MSYAQKMAPKGQSTVAKINISIDKIVLERAKAYAAEKKITFSALIAESLIRNIESEDPNADTSTTAIVERLANVEGLLAKLFSEVGAPTVAAAIKKFAESPDSIADSFSAVANFSQKKRKAKK